MLIIRILNLEFVSDFNLPAKAHRCSRVQGVCTGESGYFQIGTLFQAWQTGIQISELHAFVLS
jgi:hypothetical protein